MTPNKLGVERFLNLFEEYTPFESYLRTIVTVIILGYVLLVSSVFEVKYPHSVVELYVHPWWRLLLVLLVAIGAWWCPRVGLALGLAVFLYLNDMAILTNPINKVI